MDGNYNSPSTTDASTVDGNGKKKKRKMRVSLKGQSRQVRTDRCNKRNKGEEYTTQKGKVIMARKMKQLDLCRRKCNELFKDDDRKIIFEEYWSMGDYSKRVSYVMSLINLKQKMSERKKVDISEKQRKRTFFREYFLRINGEKKKNCCSCFLSTLGETKGFLNTVVAKCISSKSGIPQNDLTGKREPPNKHSEQDLKKAKDHILSIPSYESYYSRRDTSKRYLPSHFTLSSLYEEYKQTTDTPIGRPKYEAIFHDLNLSIKKPKKNTCNKCDTFHMRISLADGDEKENLQIAFRDHLKQADMGYTSKAQDKEKAKTDEKKEKKVLTFDLQQSLPTPFLPFYKHQLWTYNLTIHDCSDNQAYCFMWSEVDGGRGANQIASCVAKHLYTIGLPTKYVTLYSDTCGGQNKNSHMVAMFMSVIRYHNTLEVIDHKFLLAGHTYMECDSDHALIEKKKKNK